MTSRLRQLVVVWVIVDVAATGVGRMVGLRRLCDGGGGV